MRRLIPSPFSWIHHLNGNVRAIAFTLVASDASGLFRNLVHLPRKDLNRTDFHAEEASFTEELIPDHIQSWLHTEILDATIVDAWAQTLEGDPSPFASR
jgi:hypothetical protein